MSTNEIRLFGSVGESFWGEEAFSASDVLANLDGRSGPLAVAINSGGGIAHEGQAIFNGLRDYSAKQGPVTTICDGVAMSAASLIFMAGDQRIMRTGSYLLIHDPASPFTGGRGTEDDHLKHAAMLKAVSDIYAEVYASRAGISKDDARAIMRRETILDGETAVLMGFATATEAAEAQVAARFDYRIYAHAPAGLRERSRSLGEAQGRTAVLAMIAGQPRTTPREPSMADTDTAAEETSVETKDAPTASATKRERERGKRIREMVMMAKLPASLADELVDSGASIEMALTKVNARWKEEGDADIPMHGRPTMSQGHSWDSPEAFRAKMTAAVVAKIDPKAAADSKQKGPLMSFGAIAMEACKRAGLRPWNEAEAISMAGQHVTTDFGLILAAGIGDIVARRYQQRKPDLLQVSRQVPRYDYRAGNATALSSTGKPELVPEGAEVKYTTLTETGAALPKLDDFAMIFAASNQLLTNDAAAGNHLADIANRMTEGAVERLRDVLVAPLLANGGLGQTMADGKTLFHLDHGNLATVPSALSVASLGAAQTTMRRVRGPGGELLSVAPTYLLVPPELEVLALQLVASLAAASVSDQNPFAGRLQVLVEPALTNPTAWYLVGDPAAFDGHTHAYLDGMATPRIETRAGWTTLGMEWRLTWALAAGFVDYVSWFRSAGA